MKIDVVLITYGEPETTSFFQQWNYSNRILYKLTRLVAPIPKPVVPFLGAWRGYGRKKTWLAEQYASPLESITQRQGLAIQKRLENRGDGHTWRVHIAYEFRDPSLHDLLNRIKDTNCDELILVPMYLAISDFTTGISQSDFRIFQEKYHRPFPESQTVTFRACHKEIAHVMAETIRKRIRELGLTPHWCQNAGLLLGCHGTVMTPPPGIADAGYCDTKQAYDNLEEELRGEFKAVGIGWLNHRLGGEWTTPTLESSAKSMIEQGIRDFVYFPFGFLADNAETQLEGRIVLRNLGIQTYHHLPCLNDDPEFMRFLAEKIAESMTR